MTPAEPGLREALERLVLTAQRVQPHPMGADLPEWPRVEWDRLRQLWDAEHAARAALAAAPQPALDINVKRLIASIPEDAVDPYSDWSREGLAHHIAAEYERLGGEGT